MLQKWSWIGVNEKEANIRIMENRRKAWKRATRNENIICKLKC